MKVKPVKVQARILDRLIIIARGSNSVISTSKIKKITAIKKNRRENGRRADPFGSNPHSNGEFFSRSIIVFFASNEAIIITAILIINVSVTDNKIIIIAFSRNILDFLVGSQMYYYTKKATSSSVDRDIKEKSYYVNEVSISSGCFKSEVVVR